MLLVGVLEGMAISSQKYIYYTIFLGRFGIYTDFYIKNNVRMYVFARFNFPPLCPCWHGIAHLKDIGNKK